MNIPPAPPPAGRQTAERQQASAQAVRQAARGFEAMLLHQMLTAMQRAQLENGLLGSGTGAGARQTAFELLLTEALAESEPLGLAGRLAEELAESGEIKAEAEKAFEQQRNIENKLDLTRSLSFPTFHLEPSSSLESGR
ncbi:MAG: hypothetical protein JSV80_09590 [Acidobacteriota bacterium]|nr:MAG: hypothetical protein JSV80_09590 [Acidobacteriota bacterium]